MARFLDAQTFVHAAEGGFQADPRDRGNWTTGKVGQGELAGTNFGLSAMFLSELYRRPVTRAEVEALTYAQAVEVYRQHFWDPLRLDELTDQQLATLLYDGAVNQGRAVARTALRFAVRHGGGPVLGRATTQRQLVAIANTLDAARLHALAWQFRLEKYPSASPFYAGWIKRLERLRRR